jgi:hypothetical protein
VLTALAASSPEAAAGRGASAGPAGPAATVRCTRYARTRPAKTAVSARYVHMSNLKCSLNNKEKLSTCFIYSKLIRMFKSR